MDRFMWHIQQRRTSRHWAWSPPPAHHAPSDTPTMWGGGGHTHRERQKQSERERENCFTWSKWPSTTTTTLNLTSASHFSHTPCILTLPPTSSSTLSAQTPGRGTGTLWLRASQRMCSGTSLKEYTPSAPSTRGLIKARGLTQVMDHT